jgi:hypothetical protein
MPRIVAAIAIVLIGASFGIVDGSPAFAASKVSNVTFAGSPPTAGAAATWTVGFLTAGSGDLAKNGTITAQFPWVSGIPAAPVVTLGNAGTFKCSVTAKAAAATGTVIVTLADSGGTCAIPHGTSITLAIAGMTNPAALTYTAGGTVATSSETSAVASSAIVIEGARTQLVFTAQPSGAIGGAAFTAQPKVTVLDVNNNPVTTDASTVTLSFTNATPVSGGPGSLSGCSQSEASGVITFSGCTINTAGTGYKLHAVDGTLTADSAAFNVTAGSAAQIAFAASPQPAGTAGSIVTNLRVFVQDASGNTVTSAGDTITLSIATGPPGGTFNSGTGTYTNVAASSGVANFSGVFFNTAGSYTLTATDTQSGHTGFATATSPTIVITVAVSNGAAALTDTASDGGSGVQTVAYYYCAGPSGSCTSANWTSIGSSTSSAGNYLVTWTSQPVNGQYRLVVVGTDNLNNISSPSASIPVTVTN